MNWVICRGAVPIAGALGWQLTADEVAALDLANERIVNEES